MDKKFDEECHKNLEETLSCTPLAALHICIHKERETCRTVIEHSRPPENANTISFFNAKENFNEKWNHLLALYMTFIFDFGIHTVTGTARIIFFHSRSLEKNPS